MERTAAALVRAAESGQLDRRPIGILHAEIVQGARAGAIKLYAGLETGRLVKVLSDRDAAIARQFISWAFIGGVQVYVDDRACRIEAGWPDNLQVRDIRLSSIAAHPKGGGRWIAGVANGWATVTLGLTDATPHYLIAGYTGSGKTEAIRSAVVQLSRDRGNQIVLIDGKQGDGLYLLGDLPGVVAPVAIDTRSARNALAWAAGQMRERYERKRRGEQAAGRLVVVADEIQAFAGEKTGDPYNAALLQTLVTQGRGAGVHVMIGTQHPVAAAFSDVLVRRNLVGRLALRTEDYKASEVVVGGEFPRADRLLGQGDAFAIVPGHVERVQVAWIPEAQIVEEVKLRGEGNLLDAYPEADGAGEEGSAGVAYDEQELAIALAAASSGAGRPRLQAALEKAGFPRPGSNRADRLLRYSRGVHDWLENMGYEIRCLPGGKDIPPGENPRENGE